MTNELDYFIHDLSVAEPFSVAEAGVLVLGLKKFAEIATYDQVAGDGNAEAGEAAMAQMPAEPGDPVEEMAAMAPDPVAVMANCVALAMKCQFTCLYYQEMVRGDGRAEIVDALRDSSWSLTSDAKHLIRKLSLLTGGKGTPMPPVPTPQPLSDAKSIVTAVQACQQQYLVSLQALHGAMAGDPMQHTLQHMIIQQQQTSDKLAQLAPVKAAGSKLAAAVNTLLDKIAAAPKPSADAVAVPPAGSEPMDQSAMREMGLALKQVEAEKEFLANRVQQAEAVATEHASTAENAQAEAQLTAETAEAASAQAQEATLQAQEAMTSATQAEENAAAQAEGKMRLSMRIQQFRQQLADIVSQDPVGEEAMNFGEMAGAGSPMTANQQDAEVADEEAMMAEEAGGDAGGSTAKKEVNQAQRAQTEAAQQTAQAAQATGGTP